ncbi:MAG: phospho-N-acetylmuramoyl-pentapeptide-transferase [Rhodospirillaceae bacterium]|nr:phospho-N-acetylmuramoyl-pentapeptide-transferase [Rhodospirillaceae bacterium]|tara:strand:- start:830 stop:1921 length:1092 start_codon:yes stop_codon:yes gene_type:complete
MLYNLLYPLAEEAGFLNLFQYLTFRSGGAVITALIVSFVFGPVLIRILKIKQGKGQPIRKDGPEGHLLSKQGTPTMGGVIILLALLSGTLLWADLTNSYVWAIIVITLGFGVIGFADDYLKVRHQTSNGVPARVKILLEIAIAVGAVLWIMSLSTSSEQEYGLALPFVKELLINLGWFFIPFAILVIVGASNAVNLTDGLDGLAIVPIMIAAACFGVISYFVGNAVFSNYLQLHYVPGTGELSVFCGALVGAGLGFLWFNAPPAMVFMGDTGSLAAGAALGAIAIMTKHELVLAIVGGLFVLETASVIVQVGSYKLFGRRVFQMAPLHHHFEKKGLAEPTIVIRFWIISVILALIGLATLKLR